MTDQLPEQPTLPPTPSPATWPAPLDAPAPAKRRLSPLAAGLIGLALGAGTVGGAWAITASSGSETTRPAATAKASSKAATFILTGTFELSDSAIPDGAGGCQGSEGYDDIAEGTAVTVYDATGTVIATGSLTGSTYDVPTCSFDVAIPGVPTGKTFYKVEVSHRGTVQLSAKEAENGEFSATLG